MNAFDVRQAGDGGLLLQFAASIDRDVNARVIAIAVAVRDRGMAGVRDVVPTFRSVAVHFDPLRADVDEISSVLRHTAAAVPQPINGRRHEIAVAYGGDDGPDLPSVAENAGLTPAEVIQRHAQVPYRVFMLGFQPGFAYLGPVDQEIAMPRRSTPRLKVPAGSVGLAGRQTGVYPHESPGGWQIIGRALEPVFDPASSKPRFAPGDHVVFIPAGTGASHRSERNPPLRREVPTGTRRIEILRPGLFTTVQDGGGWGRQAEGFPVSGALDLASLGRANRIVGNPSTAPGLEATLAGPEVLIEEPATIAITGANLSPTLDGAVVELDTPIAARAGSILRFGARLNGMRAYIAFDGGVVAAVPRWPVTPLRAGESLALGTPLTPPPAKPVEHEPMPLGGARLRIMAGPQDDQVPPGAFRALLRGRFTVSPQSNRMGYRLTGATVPAASGEMISDATFSGAIQIPPSGEPILLLADRQTTGGYPQVATVITADLPVAGQLAPGDWVEFAEVSRAEAIAALAAREAMAGDVH